MTCRNIKEAELHAFIDGALEAERRQEMEQLIATDPELAARITAYHADMTTLKAFFAPLADQPVPEDWIALARAPRPARSWKPYAAIAAALLLVISVGIGWRMGTRGPSDVVEAALQARNSTPAAEKVLTDRGDQANAALRSAVAAKVKIPDMSRTGFKFAALRIYPKAAEIVYRDDANRIFTLYVRRSDGTVRFDQFERNGLRVCVWQDEAIAMVMSGDVSTAAMQRMASLAYTGMTM